MKMVNNPQMREFTEPVQRVFGIIENVFVDLNEAGQFATNTWLPWYGSFFGKLRMNHTNRFECNGTLVPVIWLGCY